MRRARMHAASVLLLAGALLVGSLVAAAGAATVRLGTLVISADGGFTPRVLPRRSYAPIHFQGHADIKTTDGSVPPALQRVRLDFDRDGKQTTVGLPVCPPERLTETTPQEARQRCAGALVGSGHIEAIIAAPGQPRAIERGPLSLFNGPRQNGDATVLAHAREAFPVPKTHVVTIPVEKRGGRYSYRATFDIPPIAAGFGALTHVDARIGRRFRAGGQERSYISARCSDGILETFGLASFVDGTVVSGGLFAPCRSRP